MSARTRPVPQVGRTGEGARGRARRDRRRRELAARRSAGKGPRRAVHRVEGLQGPHGPRARLRRVRTGPVELDDEGDADTTPGTALTPARLPAGDRRDALPAALRGRPAAEPAQAPGNPVRYVSGDHGDQRRRGGCRGRAEAGVDARLRRDQRADSQDRDAPADLDELLEDAPQIQAYLNQRLTLFVKQQRGSAAPARHRHRARTSRASSPPDGRSAPMREARSTTTPSRSSRR